MINTRASISALIGLTLVGCGAVPPTDANGDATAAQLELPNGGVTTTDEAPSFNDPVVETAPDLSATVGSDALLDTTGTFTGDVVPVAQRHVYRVVVLWGHLPRPQDASPPALPPAPPAPTTWSGSVSVDTGRISVRRTLAFDQGDSVSPRTDPSRVDFVSHTLPAVDGLALTVRAEGPSPALHFRTAAANFDLPLPDADGDVHYLPDGRNGVFYSAYEDRPDCAQGFVFGHWGRIRAHVGLFRGHVINAGGDPLGTIRGIWGATRHGDHVFFGKHISNTGTFNGLLGGTYADGHFAGVWGMRDGQRGELHGHYFDGIERNDGRGVFLGRWRDACPAR